MNLLADFRVANRTVMKASLPLCVRMNKFRKSETKVVNGHARRTKTYMSVGGWTGLCTQLTETPRKWEVYTLERWTCKSRGIPI